VGSGGSQAENRVWGLQVGRAHSSVARASAMRFLQFGRGWAVAVQIPFVAPGGSPGFPQLGSVLNTPVHRVASLHSSASPAEKEEASERACKSVLGLHKPHG
jgi:hypothetical protein